jgi:AraC family transcriptional regulator
MIPTIQTVEKKKLIGKHIIMSLVNNKTFELWKSFMPVRNQIKNTIGSDLYSMQVYKDDYFKNFNPAAEFEKWAALEVTDFDTIPDGMETYILPGGKYAVFHYIGNPENGAQVFGYIFKEWLPNSGYELDNRPHFELLGSKYKNGDPGSEEEIWIPIK